MLEDVSRRRKLWGMERNDFDSRAIKRLVRTMPKGKGTNQNGILAVGQINDIEARSLAILVAVCAAQKMIDGMANEGFPPGMPGEYVFREYCNALGHDDAYELMHACAVNLIKICKSISRQRRLLKMVKDVAKTNPLSQDWLEIIQREANMFSQRLDYLSGTVIPSNFHMTPFYLYEVNSGGGFEKDAFAYLGYDTRIFNEDELPGVEEYKNRIMGIIETHADGLHEVIDDASVYLVARRKNHEAISRAKKEEEDNMVQKRRDEAEEELYRLNRHAQGLVRKKLPVMLDRLFDNYSELYVVTAAVIPKGKGKPVKCGFLRRKPGGVAFTGSPESMTVYKTKGEAEEAEKSFLSERGQYGMASVSIITR